MTPEAFIDEAIAAGQRNGVAALDPNQRLVYLIAEAECLCDMEGVGAFLDRYTDWIVETAAAFEAVGASDIGAELRTAPSNAPMGDSRLDRLNELISGRVGYDFASIRRVVDERHPRTQNESREAK